MRPQYRTANQLNRDRAPTVFRAAGIAASGESANALFDKRVSKNIAFNPATPMNATFDHHTPLLRYECGCMIKNSTPVIRFTTKPPIAHGMNALTSRIAMPRNNPINRRSSSPAPPIRTHRPMKCSDSQAGQSQDIPNSAFEIAVDSSQDEKP